MTRPDPVTTVLCVLVGTDTFGYAVILPLLPFAAERFGVDGNLASGVMHGDGRREGVDLVIVSALGEDLEFIEQHAVPGRAHDLDVGVQDAVGGPGSVDNLGAGLDRIDIRGSDRAHLLVSG